MMTGICAFIRKLARDKSANVAMIFGLLLVPLVGAAGVGVDLSRGFLVQQRLNHAIDAAALAVATASEDKTEDELQELAQKYFDANYSPDGSATPGTIQVTFGDETVRILATAEVPTALMSALGIHDMNVAAHTEVTRKLSGVEVVLVLDNTGSMSRNGKIDALKTAATDLMDIMFAEEETSELIKVGLVPFSAAVNVGTQHRDDGWIDTTGRSSVNGLNFNGGRHAMQVFDLLDNKSWNGCVEARPSPMDVNDTPPTSDDGDSLWVPYFAPDEPDSSAASEHGYEYYNSYLSDDTGSNNMQTRQKRWRKYRDQTVSGDGPHWNCNTRPVTAMTGDKSDILDAIDAMNATGNTNIPQGMAWGWRLISPAEPFTEGVAYDDESFRKVIILLTDGQNVIGEADNHNRSTYGAYGFVKDRRLGTNNSSTAQDRLNDRTTDVCNNIKNADSDRPIIVYTITFQLGDGTTKDLMRNCASDPEKYFDSPSNEALRRNFEAIAGELSDLRISK